MYYYGIYYNNEYKVTKRETEMVSDRMWLKERYGETANHYQKITRLQYYLYTLLGKSVKGRE